MKIGFQVENLDPARGGAETYVYRFATELLAAGHEVHVFASGFGASPEGAFTHRIMRRGFTRWGRDRRFAWAAERAARRADLDVVVAVGRTLGADVLQPHGGTLRASRRQNRLLIRNPLLRALKALSDAVNPRVRTQLRIEARQYRADPPPEVVAISRMVWCDMQAFHRVPEGRLHLVYNGVDVAHFSPAACEAKRAAARQEFGIDDGQACFLVVAHNFKLKGVRELVAAAARLPPAPARWCVLVAGKADPGPYRRLAARLGCGDRVRFIGPLADVLPGYAAADVYVQPTWYDPCSLVVLEALACGLPVLTTRFNGASELMQDGRDGLLIDSPADTAALAAAMTRLLDADLRRAMGVAARQTAEQYPLERNFREMMAVFQRVAARKEAQP